VWGCGHAGTGKNFSSQFGWTFHMSFGIEPTTQRKGTAGQSGPQIRSDLEVCIENCGSGGIVIELESRVQSCYGDSVRLQTEQILDVLGVRHARVIIRDEGALPFVIAARVEAAAQRAGFGEGTRAVPQQLPLPDASARDRLRRTRLYVPGNEPKYLVNAALHGADAIILDLEDSVHAREKDAARLLVRNALRAVDFLHCERMVRINPFPTGLKDLEEIIPASADMVLIPKVESPAQVTDVSRKIADIKSKFGLSRATWIMPIIESALGVENAYQIAASSPEVVALTIGLEDYTADLGVAKTPGGTESLYARQRVVNAAKAARVQAIDSVFGDLRDLDSLRAWAVSSRALGFEGMGCVHPAQIPVIHSALAPTAPEIQRAREIVAAYREAQDKGLGVFSLGSKMIDSPVVQRALKLVAQAERTGRLK